MFATVRARLESSQRSWTGDLGARFALATHGRSGMARLLLGSVATRTLHQSSVPVLIHRPVAIPRTPLERVLDKVAAIAR